jgi:hypothetical protein
VQGSEWKEHGHRAGTAKAVAVELAYRLADLSGRAIGEHYSIGSGAVSAIHRKVEKDWHDVLSVVNSLAARIQGKGERQSR